jgi:hypothetical protein
MQSDYRFLSDLEPTDEQLQLLMKEVAIEVRKKAQESNKKFMDLLQQMVNAAIENKPILKSGE